MTDQKADSAPSVFAASCNLCGVALSGTLGKVSSLMAVRRSARNPNLCDRCDAHVEEGAVTEMTVVFADLSGFTAMTNELGPEKTYEITDAFLRRATDILVKHDAAIDKYLGDAVMAFFNVPIPRPDHTARALAAAEEILLSMDDLSRRFDRKLDAAIGLATGYARVGKVGSDDPRDFTAIGDVVNLASRLEGAAEAGEIVCDEKLYIAAGRVPPVEGSESLSLKGFRDGVPAYRIRPTKDGSPKARGTRIAALPGAGPAEPEGRRRPSLRELASFAFALLGAPCAGAFLFSPIMIWLNVFSAFWNIPGIVEIDGFFDSGPARVPLSALALGSAVFNVAVVRSARKRRRGAGSPRERRRERLILGLSAFSVAIVLFETFVHVVLYKKPFWN